jgi:excisionase family DNA binding protein
MRKQDNGSKSQKLCRSFKPNEPHDRSAPCSVATTIERHPSMLTPANLAVLLAVSPKSIYAWVKAGTLPACILGASIRFDPFDTAAWVRARTE